MPAVKVSITLGDKEIGKAELVRIHTKGDIGTYKATFFNSETDEPQTEISNIKHNINESIWKLLYKSLSSLRERDEIVFSKIPNAKVTALKCPKCSDIIYSRARHDCRYCSCGFMYIDGGFDYIRGGCKDIKEHFHPFSLEVPANKVELYNDWARGDDRFGLIKDVDVKGVKGVKDIQDIKDN